MARNRNQGRTNGHAGAPGRANGAANGSLAETSSGKDKDKDDKIPPGARPLPVNPGDFVQEIHTRIDLFEVWHILLQSDDVKIKQRAAERLTDLRYKGEAAVEEEPQRIVIDIDSAVARRAAQGAKK